jgi:hypothetical protein
LKNTKAKKKIRGTATVSRGGILTLRLPSTISPGKHSVILEIQNLGKKAGVREKALNFPEHNLGLWPKNMPMRRENIYDENGR